MKKIIYLFLSILIFAGASNATELNGGVSFDTNSARTYLRDGQVDNVQISRHDYFQNNDSVKKIVYSYDNDGNIIALTVEYKDETDKAYIFGRDRNLKYFEKYDRDVDLYPHRGYRYNLNGKLVLTSLTVSKKEQFRFTPEGELLAHSVKGVIYDENGNAIGKAK